MTDCNHWIPIIHDQEKAEHAEEERKHARQVYAMQDAINQIRSIINCMDGELAGQGRRKEPTLQEIADSLRVQQQQLLHEQAHQYSSAFAQQQERDWSSKGFQTASLPWEKVFGGIFR